MASEKEGARVLVVGLDGGGAEALEDMIRQQSLSLATSSIPFVVMGKEGSKQRVEKKI